MRNLKELAKLLKTVESAWQSVETLVQSRKTNHDGYQAAMVAVRSAEGGVSDFVTSNASVLLAEIDAIK